VRIEQARANLVGADAALLPSLDASMVAKRSSASFGGEPFVWNQYNAGLQSSWEVDLFGGLARQQQVALSQLQAKHAAWHDARVAVAAETANAYLAYRYCQSQMQILKIDQTSRSESARLIGIAGENGFSAPGDVALARAGAAEANDNVLKQQGQCERTLKGLVAMTALDETELRGLLNGSAEQAAKLPEPPVFRIAAIPAQVLLQRPDVAAAERDVAEASANIGVQRAKQFPKLSLSGNITPTLQNINGAALMLAQTWAIGPTLSLPLFDAGKRAADVAVAEQQYQAAASRFRDKARTAVKEVEEALVRLNSAELRMPQSRAAVDGYRANYLSLEALNQNGLGSLLDVETARRILLSAELALKTLEQERVSAWIALYRAVGGGWTASSESATQNGAPTDTNAAARLDIFTIQPIAAINGGKS
ncbi:MAG: efflux transporter outer membrane subunit, partial [Methylomonas sp.]|nr:efflux transporter outer membrane subunit [Methylomonas sp.]